MNRTYDILSGNILTARWENFSLSVQNEALLPLTLKRTKNLRLWLASRAVDEQRPNARRLKTALGLADSDEAETALAVHGVCLTDNYWIRPAGSALTWEQVYFTDDRLADLALWGRSAADECTLPSPELTNIGSFEKGWRRLNGRWWLEKQATPGEQLAELFAFHLGRALGLSMAEYKTGEGTVLTPDFTNGANLEHAFAFMGENEDYADTLAVLKNLCPAAIPDYIRMIFLDALIANPDRHTFNFGLMRNRSTGMLTGLAPLFDHNMALAGGGHTLAGMCIDLLEQYPAGREFLPAVSEEIVLHALENTGLPCDRTAVVRSVMERYRLICPEH